MNEKFTDLLKKTSSESSELSPSTILSTARKSLAAWSALQLRKFSRWVWKGFSDWLTKILSRFD